MVSDWEERQEAVGTAEVADCDCLRLPSIRDAGLIGPGTLSSQC